MCGTSFSLWGKESSKDKNKKQLLLRPKMLSLVPCCLLFYVLVMDTGERLLATKSMRAADRETQTPCISFRNMSSRGGAIMKTQKRSSKHPIPQPERQEKRAHVTRLPDLHAWIQNLIKRSVLHVYCVPGLSRQKNRKLQLILRTKQFGPADSSFVRVQTILQFSFSLCLQRAGDHFEAALSVIAGVFVSQEHWPFLRFLSFLRRSRRRHFFAWHFRRVIWHLRTCSPGNCVNRFICSLHCSSGLDKPPPHPADCSPSPRRWPVGHIRSLEYFKASRLKVERPAWLTLSSLWSASLSSMWDPLPTLGPPPHPQHFHTASTLTRALVVEWQKLYEHCSS